MTPANVDNVSFIAVRYEGNEAEQHEIELRQLGESIQGFARIFAMCANVLGTGKITRHLDSLDVRVMAVPVAEHHCFEVLAKIKSLAMSKDLWSGVFGVLLAAVVQYVLSRKDQEQMKYLNEALQQALRNNRGANEQIAVTVDKMTATIDRVMASVDKLADALRPAARQALMPIGRSCERIDLYSGDRQPFLSLGPENKQAFADANAVLSDHLASYIGVISEFDMATGACKITLDGEPSRIAAIVTDPIFNRPNNPYVEAMAGASALRFLAKADLDADGNPSKLYISDTAEQG